MKYLSLLIVFFTAIILAQGQTYIISNGTINTCGGTFYDSGGAGGNYNSNESFTETFCSNLPGSTVTITFTSFSSESCCDHLYIYDSTNTSGNLLIQAEGTNPPGFLGTPFTSSSGCLTIVWTSDGSVEQSGWVATITCTYDCQPFNVNITNPSTPFFSGDTIHICQNTPLTLNAAGVYNPAINYPQSDNTTTFTWNFGDASAPVSGAGMTGVTHTWPEGAYYVTLTGTDINNCVNSNLARIMVLVSLTPTFTGTGIAPDTICPGEQVILDGRFFNVHPTTWAQVIDTMVAGLTYLPDGQGVPYETSITNTLFLPGQTMTSVTDIVNVCINMEHSYLGDLTIHLVCPDGQFLNIFTYPDGLGSTYFGIPIDDDANTAPGTGWTYCWTPQATSPIPNMGGQSVPTGDYQPTGPFTDLLNCQMNGQWTIHVEDHLGSDNGYIFWWSMQFDQSIIPPQFSFSNTYDSTIFSWTGQNIVSQSNGYATAAPAIPGTNGYTLEVYDDYGCPYDTTITMFVRAMNDPTCCVQPVTFAGNDDTVCVSSYTFQAGLNPGNTGAWTVVNPAPGTATIANPNSENSLVTVSQYGTYYFVWTESVAGQPTCNQKDTVAITFYQTPTSTFNPTEILCYGDSTVITYTGNTVAPAFFDWQISGAIVSNPPISTASAGPYTIKWPVAGTYDVSLQVTQNGCTSTITTEPVPTPPELTYTYSLVHNPCNGDALGSITITNTGGSLPYSYLWSNGAATNVIGNLTAGFYDITVTDDNTCSYTDSFEITEPLLLQNDTSFKNISCFNGNDGFLNNNISGGVLPYAYTWSPPLPAPGGLQTNLTANTYNVTIQDDNGCTITETFVLTQPDELVVQGSPDVAICFGTSTNLLVTYSDGGTLPYTYLWDGIPGTSTSVTRNPAFTTDYVVQIRDSYNCFSNIDTIHVLVSQLMTGSLTVNNVKCYNYCNGSAIYTISGGIPPLDYSWPSAIPTLSNLCDGIYQVTVTDSIGCNIDTAFQVTEPSLLVASASASPASCFGYNDGSVSITVQGGTLPYGYNWSNGINTPASGYLFAGTYNCIVTDANACTITRSVTVTQPPEIYVVSSGDQTICIGGSAEISALAMGGSYPYLYNWLADTLTYFGNTVQASPLTTTVYHVTVTDANGCKAAPQSVKINVLPPLSISSYTIDDTICPGESSRIRVSITGGSGGPYRIYLNNGTIVTPPFDVFPTVSQTYTIRAYDKCETPPVNDSVDVYVLPSQPIDIHVSKYEGCVPLTVSFIESSADSGQTYLWRFGEGLGSEGSVAKNVTHTFFNAGSFPVTLSVTSKYGCTETDSVGVPINAYPVPEARFNLDPQLVSIADPKVTFTNFSGGADTSFWFFGDGDSSHTTHPVHNYPSVGTFKVELVAASSHSCTDTASAYVTIRDEFTLFSPTAFSPNNDGFNDYFWVSGNGIHPDNYQFLIYNRWGEIIFSTKEPGGKWDGKYKGKIVEFGSYTWVLYYKDTNGINYQKSGIVTVLR